MAFNILVVDDSEVIRSIISRTINMSGVPVGEIYAAGNGEQALKVLGGNWIDLVLADINMPVMDGVAMIDKMHEDEVMSHIPIVVISTEGSASKMEKLRSKGMKAFVRKPFTPEAIRDVISNILGEWENDNEGNGEDAF